MNHLRKLNTTNTIIVSYENLIDPVVVWNLNQDINRITNTGHNAERFTESSDWEILE